MRGPHPLAAARPRAGFFLKLILCRSKNRHTALRLPAIRRLRITATISSSVKSGCSAISRSKTAACASSGEMLPPLGLAAMLPVSFKRCIHLIAELALTSTHSFATDRCGPKIAPCPLFPESDTNSEPWHPLRRVTAVVAVSPCNVPL